MTEYYVCPLLDSEELQMKIPEKSKSEKQNS